MSKRKDPKLTDQVRQAIEDCDETCYRIAMETGIDKAVLSRFMAGTQGMSLRTLDVLAEHLGLSIVCDKRKGK